LLPTVLGRFLLYEPIFHDFYEFEVELMVMSGPLHEFFSIVWPVNKISD